MMTAMKCAGEHGKETRDSTFAGTLKNSINGLTSAVAFLTKERANDGTDHMIKAEQSTAHAAQTCRSFGWNR